MKKREVRGDHTLYIYIW